MLGKVSFTGAMLVQGTDRQLESIRDKIFQNAVDCDAKGFSETPMKENFDFNGIRHDGRFSSTNCTDLFVTKDDALDLSKYYRTQNEITKNHNGLKAVATLNNGNPDMWLDECNDLTKFYKENIEKFVKLPEKVHSATEVLEAIKNGLFDFANLVIKNAK